MTAKDIEMMPVGKNSNCPMLYYLAMVNLDRQGNLPTEQPARYQELERRCNDALDYARHMCKIMAEAAEKVRHHDTN